MKPELGWFGLNRDLRSVVERFHWKLLYADHPPTVPLPLYRIPSATVYLLSTNAHVHVVVGVREAVLDDTVEQLEIID